MRVTLTYFKERLPLRISHGTVSYIIFAGLIHGHAAGSLPTLPQEEPHQADNHADFLQRQIADKHRSVRFIDLLWYCVAKKVPGQRAKYV